MSGALQMGGQLLAGNSQGNAYDYNAAVARQNASADLEGAAVDSEAQDRQNVQARGKTQAAYGASGVTMSGSALDVLSDQAAQGELASQLIQYRGRLAANQQTSQATLDTYMGSTARTAGYIGAAGTLMNNAAGAAGNSAAYSMYG